MGGKSSDNGKMIKMQQQQADEARRREADRQTRIQQGLANIKAAFEGGTTASVKAGQKLDWSKYGGLSKGQGELPPGFSFVALPSAPAAAATTRAFQPGATRENKYQTRTTGQPANNRIGGSLGQRLSGGNAKPFDAVSSTAAAAAAPKTYGIRGPDGKIYKVGDDVYYDETTTSGSSTGFNQDFYDKFKAGMKGFYLPQVAEKFTEAKDQLKYGLARAGQLESRAGNKAAADLNKQNVLNNAEVISKADQGAADIATRVAQERANAEAQLYNTDNPDMATSSALSSVKNISLDKPPMSALGEIFKIALVGGANAMNGYRTGQMRSQIPAAYRNDGSWTVNS